MGFLKILLDAIAQFVRLCAITMGTLFSTLFGRSATSSATRRGSSWLRGRRGKIVGAVCLVVIVASVARLLVMIAGPSKRADAQPYQALGTVCAEQISKLLGGHGQVVVIAWDTSRYKMPSIDAALASFERALRKAGVHLQATEIVPPPADVFPTALAPEPLTGETLKAIIARHQGADAIVSFVGVPQIKGEDIEQWPRGAPKLVSVGSHDPGGRLQQLLKEKIVEYAILPRLVSIPSGGKKPKTDRERFDENFQIVVSASAGKPTERSATDTVPRSRR